MGDVDVKHVAWLARIQLSDEEVELFKRLVNSAMKLINKLLEAPVEDVEPLYHALDKEGLLRSDKPSIHLDRERVLANAAKSQEGYIVAPRTVEE
ncbi:Asp-tRNA(Asn)/Glu-tRNA(Gln) amidotransferase subunit GatC [Hyperthermus butylicus]|uniref:Aspartyl/glutamyl-tRNA(Asn/Gln) amidotransferase subunit C n=1 Tax=Hyperthermus butylicus (strain DSM 5456 / JCM 9403 / PLM1-5) TaxID=415426 RepID=A2BLU9_HYPBU|nr:Asp-tRNA(Asn)/Glu-tRNA(Gln) amidotransferase subunit GatC [Hyperthermus butylicus]ABM80960.1 glutamyl-tRNA amidotransferase subunit C [Hyperthermus butylicus DSM 5456]